MSFDSSSYKEGTNRRSDKILHLPDNKDLSQLRAYHNFAIPQQCGDVTAEKKLKTAMIHYSSIQRFALGKLGNVNV